MDIPNECSFIPGLLSALAAFILNFITLTSIDVKYLGRLNINRKIKRQIYLFLRQMSLFRVARLQLGIMLLVTPVVVVSVAIVDERLEVGYFDETPVF